MTDEAKSISTSRRRILTGAAAGVAATVVGSAMGGRQASAQAVSNAVSARRNLAQLGVSNIEMGIQNQSRTFSSLVPNRADMVSLIREARDLGVTFFDCAELHGPFLCLKILGEAIAPFRNEVAITTKFGFDVDPDTGVFGGGVTSRPERTRLAGEDSLRRLRTDRIDLLSQHRVDPTVPIEDVAGTVRDLMDEGKVLHCRLSEMGPNTVRRAHAELPLTAVQCEQSMLYRERETDILPVTVGLDIGSVPYAPLDYGFLTEAVDMTTQFSPYDFRASTPRMGPENREHNLALVEIVKRWAEAKSATPRRSALAWLMAQRPDIVPIPGTTNLMHLRDNVGATAVQFTRP